MVGASVSWWVVVLLCVVHAHGFFFNFKGGGGGGGGSGGGKRPSSGGKYPSSNRVPTNYGRPTRPISPAGGKYRPPILPPRPVRPVTTYGPPVRPSLTLRPSLTTRPQTTYGPPSTRLPSWPGVAGSNGKGAVVTSGTVWGSGGGSIGVSTGGNSGTNVWNNGNLKPGSGNGKYPSYSRSTTSKPSGGALWKNNNHSANKAKQKHKQKANSNHNHVKDNSNFHGNHENAVHSGHAGGVDKGALTHHTHFHSHYHTSFAGGWSAVSPQTLLSQSALVSPRTVSLQRQVTTVTASISTASSSGTTNSSAYLPSQDPEQAQASGKVNTFVKPDSAKLDAVFSTDNQQEQGVDRAPRLFASESSTPPATNASSTSTPTASTTTLGQSETQLSASIKPRLARSLTDALVSLKLGKFIELVRRAGIQDVFKAKGGFTVFAFTDEAWYMLPSSTRALLTADRRRLRDLLLHHVTPVELPAANFNNEMLVKSASSRGSLVRINVYQLTRFSQRIVTVNGAVVEATDETATNGVVHVISGVLVREARLDALQFVSSSHCADLNFSAVSSMLKSLEMTSLLSRDAPFTLFLPITAAFSTPSHVLTDFFNNSATMLDTLMYHIVPGSQYSAGMRDGQWLSTLLDGQELQLQVVTDGFSRRISTVSKQAQVIEADIPVTNGVVHIVDFVIRPERNLQQCSL